MGIFSKTIVERDQGESKYVNSAQLIAGEKWQIIGADIVKATNAKFGAIETDALAKSGVLHDGETVRYTFLDASGKEKIYDSKSAAIYIAFKNPDFNPNDWVKISREGTGDKTRYTITKVA